MPDKKHSTGNGWVTPLAVMILVITVGVLVAMVVKTQQGPNLTSPSSAESRKASSVDSSNSEEVSNNSNAKTDDSDDDDDNSGTNQYSIPDPTLDKFHTEEERWQIYLYSDKSLLSMIKEANAQGEDVWWAGLVTEAQPYSVFFPSNLLGSGSYPPKVCLIQIALKRPGFTQADNIYTIVEPSSKDMPWRYRTLYTTEVNVIKNRTGMKRLDKFSLFSKANANEGN